MDNLNLNYTTIVTCYFKIPSKHSQENYKKWMTNMLTNISTPMVIFCDPESESFITELRKDYINKTHIIVLSIDDFYTSKYKDKFIEHHEIDPEKKIHSVPLYMIWAEKSNFLKRAKTLNPFNSNFFFWCDIGCFRNRQEKNDVKLDMIKFFPNERKVRSIPTNKVILIQTGRFAPNCCSLNSNGLTIEEFTYYSHTISGTMFGGHSEIIDEWHQKYYETLERFIDNNRFAGKDQSIMANMFVQYPDLVHVFQPTYGDPWFYFHWLLL